jgi:hypothetical protein
MTECTLLVSFKGSWVNGWFLRIFTRAFVDVNGEEVACPWREITSISVAPGAVHLTSFIRYRGTSPRLGSGSIEFVGTAGAQYRLVARNGVMNQTPFTPSLVS